MEDGNEVIKAVVWGFEDIVVDKEGSTAGAISAITWYNVKINNRKGEERVIKKRFNDFVHLVKKLKSSYREFDALQSPSILESDPTKRTSYFDAVLKILCKYRPVLPEADEFFEVVVNVSEPSLVISSSSSPTKITAADSRDINRFNVTIAGFEDAIDSSGSKFTHYFVCLEDSIKDGMAYIRRKRYSDFLHLYTALIHTHSEVKLLYFPSKLSGRQHRRDSLQNLFRILIRFYPHLYELFNFLGVSQRQLQMSTGNLYMSQNSHESHDSRDYSTEGDDNQDSLSEYQNPWSDKYKRGGTDAGGGGGAANSNSTFNSPASDGSVTRSNIVIRSSFSSTLQNSAEV